MCKTKTVARVADSLPILIPPADNTTECTGSLNWPAVQNLSVSYDCPCDGNPSSVAPIVVTQPGECENTGTQIRTWQATDCWSVYAISLAECCLFVGLFACLLC